MHPLILFGLALLLDALAIAIHGSTRFTRGRGSWNEDVTRYLVAGALYGYSLLVYGLAIAALFA